MDEREKTNTIVTPYIGIENDRIYDNVIVNFKKTRKYSKKFCIIIVCLSCTVLVCGFLFLDYKCDVFSDSVTLCDLPNYCPIKNECHGSNIE